VTTVYSQRMEYKRPFEAIPDDELLGRLSNLIGQSRRVEAEVVTHIGERGLYAREAAPSMFVYCTEVLHLSEGRGLSAHRGIPCLARASDAPHHDERRPSSPDRSRPAGRTSLGRTGRSS
jgi:hypothetical protein